jgi:hypothetical protein
MGGKDQNQNFVKGPDGSEETQVKGEGTDDPQTERGERTGSCAITPAQGLERDRDGGEVQGHDSHTVMIYSRGGMRHQCLVTCNSEH